MRVFNKTKKKSCNYLPLDTAKVQLEELFQLDNSCRIKNNHNRSSSTICDYNDQLPTTFFCFVRNLDTTAT